MFKRLFVALLVAGAMIGATYGAAASLGGVTAPQIGASGVDVDSCDTDGVTVAFAHAWVDGSGEEITTVTVSDINSDGGGAIVDCDGATLSVQLTTGADVALGTPVSLVGTIDAASEVVDFTSQTILVSALDDIHVLIEGP